jgi:hypothetical protein
LEEGREYLCAFFFFIPAALNTALPSPLRVGIYSHLKRERADLRPAGTGGLYRSRLRRERGWGKRKIKRKAGKNRKFPRSKAVVRNSEF